MYKVLFYIEFKRINWLTTEERFDQYVVKRQNFGDMFPGGKCPGDKCPRVRVRGK